MSPMPVWKNSRSLSRMRRGECRNPENPERRSYVQNLCHPKLVGCVLLQVVIFAIVVWFSRHIRTTGPVILPSTVLQFARSQPPRVISYVVTLVATVISFLNTLLLGLVLQVALTARMSRPMSLQTFRGWFSLVTGQKLLGVRGFTIIWTWMKSLACMRDGRKNLAPGDRQYWKWLGYTLFYAAVCGPLTSSWTSFLAPTSVILEFPFTGKEADLVGIAAQLQADSDVSPYPSENSHLVVYMNAITGMKYFGYGLADVTMYLQAGIGATTDELGSPYYIPYQGSLYNGSTGGIYTNISMVLQDADTSFPEESTQTYTMYHQGLTAEVNCRQQRFIDAVGVYPSAVMYNSTISGNSSTTSGQAVATDHNIFKQWMATDCSSESVAYTDDMLTLIDLNGTILGDGYLLGSVCKYQDFEKATNQSFLVLMQGFYNYSFIEPTICEVSPLFTVTQVEFDGSTVNIMNTTDLQRLSPDGQQAVYVDAISDIIWLMMFDGQSISGNLMAAGIQDLDYSTSALSDISLSWVLENYLRGSIELYGTIWRQNIPYYYPNNTHTNEYNGAIHVRSLGYQYRQPTYLFLIVPLSLVVLATCFAAAYAPVAQAKKPVDLCLVEDGMTQGMMDGPLRSLGDFEDFDPTNIIHLMMVTSRTQLDGEVGRNELLQIHLDSTNSNIPEAYMGPFQEDDHELLLKGKVHSSS